MSVCMNDCCSLFKNLSTNRSRSLRQDHARPNQDVCREHPVIECPFFEKQGDVPVAIAIAMRGNECARPLVSVYLQNSRICVGLGWRIERIERIRQIHVCSVDAIDLSLTRGLKILFKSNID